MFSATHASLEGFRIIGRRPLSMIVWTLVYALISFAFIAGACYFLGSTFIGEIIRHHDDPSWARDIDIDTWDQAWTYFGPMFQAIGILIPATMLLGCIQLCGVFRIVLRPQDRGFAFLKLGADELRQFGLMILFTLLFAIVVFGPVIGLICAVKLGGLDGGMAALIGVLGGLALIALVIWLAVRLSLAPPATFARRRIVLFGAWGLTKNHFWGLVGMYLLAAVFTIVLSFVLDMIARMVGGAMGFSMTSLFDGEHFAIDFDNLTPQGVWSVLGYGGLVYLGISMLANTFQLALSYGPQAAAYRDLMAERNPPPAPEPEYAAPPADHGGDAPASPSADSHGGHGTDAALAAAAVAGGAAAVMAAEAHAHEHADHAPADHGPADHGVIDHGHAEPAVAEPHAEAIHTEPVHAEPAPQAYPIEHGHAEHAPEPAHAEPVHAEPAPVEHHAEAHPAEHHAEPPAPDAHAAPEQNAEPAHAEPAPHAEPEHDAAEPAAEPAAHPADPHDEAHPDPHAGPDHPTGH